MKENQRYTIEDLVRLTGLTRRTIRFYIQEGLLEPPAGRGRGGFYSQHHLDTLRRIQKLREQGLRIATIRRVLHEGEEVLEQQPDYGREAWARIILRPGLEIHIRHDLETEDREAVQELIRLAKLLFKPREGSDDRSK